MPLERGRHGVLVDSGALRVEELIVRPEKKQLVPRTVEVRFGDDNRASQRAAGIFVAVSRFRGANLVIEELIGIELFITEVIIRAAVKLRRAVLDGQVELAAVARAIFGGIVAR